MAIGRNLMIAITAMVLLSAGILGALVLMNPTPEDTSISVSISSPFNGATVTGVLNVSATVSSVKAVSQATLWMDGKTLGNKSSGPFYWLINSTHYEEGQHILNISALNAAGKMAGDQVTITVNNGGTTVGILSPNNQTKVNGTITVSPQVVTPRGISFVSCIMDGIEIGNLSEAPFSFEIDTTGYLNGNHDIAVLVEDEIGMKGMAEVTPFFDNPFTIVDDRGKAVTFDSTPQRIICLGSSFTEIVYGVGADHQLIGVDNSSTFPAAASTKVQVGQPSTPSMELIRELQPDCIIIWSYSYNSVLIATLEANPYKVVGYAPKSVATIEKTIVSIGNLTGRNPQAVSMVAGMEMRIQKVTEKVANYTMGQRPLVYYEQANTKSVGAGTIGNEIITLAGGRNIYANVTGNPTLNLEAVRLANPNIIIVDNASSTTNTMIAERSGWSNIDAIQQNHIYRINARMMSITPRLVDAIEQMVEWFYPTLDLG
jgi:iron complex transport system substrate-binding protein